MERRIIRPSFKKFVVVTIYLSIICYAIWLTVPFYWDKYNDKTDIVWRNHSWNTKPDNRFILLPKDSTQEYSVYKLKNEPTCLGTEHLDSVHYRFFKNEMESVTVFIHTPQTSHEAENLRNLMGSYKFNEPYDLRRNEILLAKQKYDSICLSKSYVNTNEILSYYRMKFSTDRDERGWNRRRKDANEYDGLYAWYHSISYSENYYHTDYDVILNLPKGTITYTNHIVQDKRILFIKAQQDSIAESVTKFIKDVQFKENQKIKEKLKNCGI